MKKMTVQPLNSDDHPEGLKVLCLFFTKSKTGTAIVSSILIKWTWLTPAIMN